MFQERYVFKERYVSSASIRLSSITSMEDKGVWVSTACPGLCFSL